MIPIRSLSKKVKKIENTLQVGKGYRRNVEVKICSNGTPSWCVNYDIEYCTKESCPGWYNHTEKCKKLECFIEGKPPGKWIFINKTGTNLDDYWLVYDEVGPEDAPLRLSLEEKRAVEFFDNMSERDRRLLDDEIMNLECDNLPERPWVKDFPLGWGIYEEDSKEDGKNGKN